MDLTHETEDEGLRLVALQNAQRILAARERAEQELTQAKEALEVKAAELAQSLSMVRATLEAVTDGILVTDGARKITDFNDRYVKMWQVPMEIMEKGEHERLMDFIATSFAEPDRFLARIEAIYASEPPETLDLLELADGRVIERLTKLRLIDGQRMGRVWSFHEVTDRRRAEREHAYLAAIVATSNDVIVSKSLEGIITSWNKAAERTFGYSAEEAIGQSITLIIPDDRIEEERSILERVRKGEGIDNFETVRRRKDGNPVFVSLTISPVMDATGQIIGVSKVARDITEREQLLVREQAARARAEEASRLKDEFLATVSHELRTPLNAILGWAHVLRSGQIEGAKARHAAEVVERNARAQAQVIEDLLDVSRIISGKLHLEMRPLMPVAAVESALESLRPMAEAKGVALQALLDPLAGPVSGDAGRLQQVMWNLFSNAIKFTPKGGRVDIRLERIESHVEITVTDTGEGIGAEFLPYVFDRFRQGDASSTRATSGLGLGLAIVRHLVELHGGKVMVDSPGKGQGATFSVKFPLRAIYSRSDDGERAHPRAGAVETYLPPGQAPSLTGVRVLVVDDEPDARDLLRQILEQCGAVVRDAGSVSQALGVLEEWRPGVIVSDIGMPGEDGYVLIRRVREWEKKVGTWIPAVALTAYARGQDRTMALLAGYQVHATKPIEPMEFALIVAGVVQPPTP